MQLDDDARFDEKGNVPVPDLVAKKHLLLLLYGCTELLCSCYNCICCKEIDVLEAYFDSFDISFTVSDDEEQEKEDEPDIQTLIRSQFDRRPALPALSSRRGTARSVTSVMLGVGELDRTTVEPRDYAPNRPFLVLDVRDPDLFIRAHISLAVNYPAIRSTHTNFTLRKCRAASIKKFF